MITTILDGKSVAARISEKTREITMKLPRKPGLAILLVGDNAASHKYVELKEQAAEQCGVRIVKQVFPAATDITTLLRVISEWNITTDIDAILVQLPLPEPLNLYTNDVILQMDPSKDVDGFHPTNIDRFSKLMTRKEAQGHTPVLVQAVMELLDETRIALHHKRAVILGKSDVFLRPLAHGLSLMGLDPVLAGSDPAAPLAAALLQRADVVVTAIGKAGILTSNSLRESAVVIDIGQTPKSGRLSGDFDVSTAEGRVRFYTPVPGGVGPVTVAAMIHAVAVRCQNTLRALGRA